MHVHLHVYICLCVYVFVCAQSTENTIALNCCPPWHLGCTGLEFTKETKLPHQPGRDLVVRALEWQVHCLAHLHDPGDEIKLLTLAYMTSVY